MYPPYTIEKDSQPLHTVEEFEALGRVFEERDKNHDLKNLSLSHKLALNIYTTGFYKVANPLLRGQLPKPEQMESLPELLVTSAIAICGLNNIGEEAATPPQATFRGEVNLPEAVLKDRIKASHQKNVTLEMGFISTSIGRPCDRFAFTNNEEDEATVSVGIIYKDVRGKSIQAVSVLEHENEYLMPPTSVQWEHVIDVDKGHIFIAHPVTTPTGLSTEALSSFIEDDISYEIVQHNPKDKMRISESFDKQEEDLEKVFNKKA